MSRASPLQVVSFFLLGLILVPRTAFGQNPNRPIENKDFFVSETGDETIKNVRIAQGVNLNTEAFARHFGVTPFDIRRENPTMTLALCKKNGRFHMSPGIISPETRRFETAWNGCDEKNRYTYIVPGSTLHINVGKHHPTFEQERQAVEVLEACPKITTVSCVAPALELLGMSLEVAASAPVATAIPKPVVKAAKQAANESAPKVVIVEKTPNELMILIAALIGLLIGFVCLTVYRGRVSLRQQRMHQSAQNNADMDYADLKKRFNKFRSDMAALAEDTAEESKDKYASLVADMEASKKIVAGHVARLKEQGEVLAEKNVRIEELEHAAAAQAMELHSKDDELRAFADQIAAWHEPLVRCRKLYEECNIHSTRLAVIDLELDALKGKQEECLSQLDTIGTNDERRFALEASFEAAEKSVMGLCGEQRVLQTQLSVASDSLDASHRGLLGFSPFLTFDPSVKI